MQPVPMMGMAPMAPTSTQMTKTQIQTTTATTTSLNNNSINQVRLYIPWITINYVLLGVRSLIPLSRC